MRILVAEDNSFKKAHIVSVLKEVVPDAEIDVRRAFSSSIHKLLRSREKYDLAILDDTMPHYEQDPNSDIIQNCAELFLDYLDEYGIEETKCIICSAYDSSNKEEQFKHLKNNYKNCIGFVKYECNSVVWTDKMKEMIQKNYGQE